jgi:hypothetical protein
MSFSIRAQVPTSRKALLFERELRVMPLRMIALGRPSLTASCRACPTASPMTFGRVLRTMQVGDFVLMETIHPPGLRLARHEHRDASLNLVLTGSFVESFARRSYSCDPWTVSYKPQGESHSNRYNQVTSRSVLVAFQSPAISRLRAFTRDLDGLWCVRGGQAAAAMRELYGELCFPDQATPLIVEGCI